MFLSNFHRIPIYSRTANEFSAVDPQSLEQRRGFLTVPAASAIDSIEIPTTLHPPAPTRSARLYTPSISHGIEFLNAGPSKPAPVRAMNRMRKNHRGIFRHLQCFMFVPRHAVIASGRVWHIERDISIYRVRRGGDWENYPSRKLHMKLTGVATRQKSSILTANVASLFQYRNRLGRKLMIFVNLAAKRAPIFTSAQSVTH